MKRRAFAVLVLLATIIGGCSAMSDNEGHVKEWVGKMFPGDRMIASDCATMDTDWDGYVSCQLNMEKQGLVMVECHWLWGNCREPKIGRRW